MTKDIELIERKYGDAMQRAWGIVRAQNDERVGPKRRVLTRAWVWATPSLQERLLEDLQAMPREVDQNLHRCIVTQSDPLLRQGIPIENRVRPFNQKLEALKDRLSSDEMVVFQTAKCATIALVMAKYEAGLGLPCKDVPQDVSAYIGSIVEEPVSAQALKAAVA